MKVYIDSREKDFKHIADYFQEVEQEYEIRRLETGDYQASSGSNIIIERKRSVLEFAGNIGKNHQRFFRELKRAKKERKKMIILIEEKLNALSKQVCNRAFRKLSVWVCDEDREMLDGIQTRCLDKIKASDPLFLLNFWSDRKCQIQGDTIYKHCVEIIEWYGVEFVFCEPKNSGKIILEYLRGENG